MKLFSALFKSSGVMMISGGYFWYGINKVAVLFLSARGERSRNRDKVISGKPYTAEVSFYSVTPPT